ncbi:MAG: metallopeptidase family protein [Thermomicrobiales bacterium]
MLDNVAVVVEDEPRAGQHHADGDPDDGGDLFGYYEGTPLTDRTSSYGLQTPDRIVIFRKPLERAFPEQAMLRDEVMLTIIHELAHHVGYDEAGIAARGWE